MRKWKTAGYIALSRNRACVIIKVINPARGAEYYVADINEVLEVLTKRAGYAKIYKSGSR